MRRCYDLQKAEAEVDLLGDQVEALLGLLEKIYITLNHYSPVLQHYFGRWRTPQQEGSTEKVICREGERSFLASEKSLERAKMASNDLESRGRAKNRGNNNPSPYYSSSYYNENSEKKWKSWLIPMFVVANVAVFIIAMYINNCPRTNSGFQGNCVAKFLGRLSFQPLRENPLFGPSSSTFKWKSCRIWALLVSHEDAKKKSIKTDFEFYPYLCRLEKLGALEWNKVVHRHQGWRLVTCIWLHAGIIHLVANMVSLVFIGIRLEQQFGFVRIGVVYLWSGFGGSILSSLFIQNNISVGASGALFGLLGAMLSELITNWSIYTDKAAALFTLVAIIAINLAIGILPHVDNFAHIGGFMSGFLFGFVMLLRPQFGWVAHRNLPANVRAKPKYKAYQYILWLVALVLLIVGFTGGMVMLFRGENGNKHCSWCHYLSCVPTSRWKCGN
ncbi:hypothetical protein HHK36_001090 [Tetracentron sinense]|uniref:RHOMBOID-like protein n=1 Tax=Tetracentron sinense TaxID=13715 RepID=A0A834ZS78_TETSI|nr:hypothetical protein HHK36_001090 [Tetracentron sinense]